MKRENIRVHTIALMAVLIAMEIILSRLLSIRTPIVVIGFGFVAVAVAGMMMGPFRAGVVAALADMIGVMLFPTGAYFPGFTVTAFMTGLIYGLVLHDPRPKFWRVIVAVLVINLVCSLALDTCWLYMITGKGILALLPARLAKCAVMAPVQVMTIQLLTRLIRFPAHFRSA